MCTYCAATVLNSNSLGELLYPVGSILNLHLLSFRRIYFTYKRPLLSSPKFSLVLLSLIQSILSLIGGIYGRMAEITVNTTNSFVYMKRK